jgi:hypothetical protein
VHFPVRIRSTSISQALSSKFDMAFLDTAFYQKQKSLK